MNFGDCFSDSFREDYAQRNLKVGTVLKLKVFDTYPPKEKRFIIVGKDEEEIHLAAVYINSEINRVCNFSQELIDLQLYLKANDREYLDHDSYVDCARLYIKEKNLIHQSILHSPATIIGQVSETDLFSIRTKIIKAKTIKGKIKKKFGIFDKL